VPASPTRPTGHAAVLTAWLLPPRSSVAAAIRLFGFQSGAALATVVGALVEVPAMLPVVWIV
jgi:ACR3 family arsenite efflux pump ArsB